MLRCGALDGMKLTRIDICASDSPGNDASLIELLVFGRNRTSVNKRQTEESNYLLIVVGE